MLDVLDMSSWLCLTSRPATVRALQLSTSCQCVVLQLDVACHAAHAWFFPKPAKVHSAKALGFNEGWSNLVASSPTGMLSLSQNPHPITELLLALPDA